ncbi:MAG: dethiobiotin synthase [Deltaproteobacteria bacterium]|jgi:dethiobiotin synthetase
MGKKHVFIGGTGMNVGKTLLIRALARALIDDGLKVIAIKAVEGWCDRSPEGQEDGELIAAATGQTWPPRALVRLRSSLSPAMAAQVEGIEIDWSQMIGDMERAADEADVVLVEGAGGVTTPLTWQHSNLAIATSLNAPLLLLGRDHAQGATLAIMALAAAKLEGVRTLGVCMSVVEDADPTTGTNAATVQRFCGVERMVVGRRMDTNAPVDRWHVLASKTEAVRTMAGWVRGYVEGRITPEGE